MLRSIILALLFWVSAVTPSAAQLRPSEDKPGSVFENLDRALKEMRRLRDQERQRLEVEQDRLPTEHPKLLALPGIEAWYLVQPDGSIKLHRGTANERHQKEWDLLRKVVDKPIQEVYTTFVAYKHRETSGAVTMALVVTTKIEPLRHGIATNQVLYSIKAGLPDTLYYMLSLPIFIHEYWGHTKVWTHGMMPDRDGCMIGREVAPALKRFQERFWKDCKVADRKMKKRMEDYPSDYAMDTVAEDYAETAAAFVLCAKPAANSKRVVAEKLRFFWSDPESVDYRTKVRKAMRFDKMLGIMVDTNQAPVGFRCS